MANFVTGEDFRMDLAPAVGLASGVAVWTVFSVKKYTLKFKRPRLEVPNSEGRAGNPDIPNPVQPWGVTGKMSATHGETAVECTIEEATLDMDANIIGDTFQIAELVWLWVRIYPLFSNADFHLLHLMLDEGTLEGEVGQYQPVSFKGETDARYALFGQSKTGL